MILLWSSDNALTGYEQLGYSNSLTIVIRNGKIVCTEYVSKQWKNVHLSGNWLVKMTLWLF